MGFIGGAVGYQAMKLICPTGETGYLDGKVYEHKSKLEILLGKSFWGEIRDRTVIDFGCGFGAESIEMAERGAKKVIGVDINEGYLDSCRALAASKGVTNCEFVTSPSEKADVIVSLDAFEHFSDPGSILKTMREMLSPNGVVIASFGPTWYHPLGGHLLTVFPWSHLIFTERAQLRYRADIRSDRPKTFMECGLNQMSIRRFEQVVADSPFRFDSFEAVPIKRLKRLHSKWTREFTSAIVRCRMRPR